MKYNAMTFLAGLFRPAQTRNTTMQVSPARTTPQPQADGLKHCRCTDCRYWIKWGVRTFCEHGFNCDTVSRPPDFPPNQWHYCAEYHQRTDTGLKKKLEITPEYT